MTNKKKTSKPVERPKYDIGDENESPKELAWTLSIGIYPGVLFGLRTYKEPTFTTHVLYLPFIDIALEIDK